MISQENREMFEQWYDDRHGTSLIKNRTKYGQPSDYYHDSYGANEAWASWKASALSLLQCLEGEDAKNKLLTALLEVPAKNYETNYDGCAVAALATIKSILGEK